MQKNEKAKIKRDAIVKATIRLVNSRGFHATPMAKLAKMANVSPGTIYLYFQNKQDLVNKVYLEVKERLSVYSFANHDTSISVEDNFNDMWYRIAEYQLKETQEALFLGQCVNTPIIDDNVRDEGVAFLAPLVEVMNRGKQEGLIKDVSNYLLYASTMSPLSLLLVMNSRNSIELNKEFLEDAYRSAWDSIKK